MTANKNPFEYQAASDLPPGLLLDFYIEDFNYSRFIQSRRNILLVGERGSGKSMALLYNSWKIQALKAKRQRRAVPLDLVGVFVPSNTPLTQKREHDLLDPVPAAILAEHHLVLEIAYKLADTLGAIPGLVNRYSERRARERLAFVLGAPLDPKQPVFEALMDYLQQQNVRGQQSINARESESVRLESTFSFSSLVIPLLGFAQSLPALQQSHFMILLDDADHLNEHQLKAVASWIAYRDHSLFSFKLAVANMRKASLRTASGGNILEGHDYTRLDMVPPFQNETSDFGRLAGRIVAKRLKTWGIEATPQEFFPVSPTLKHDLEVARDQARAEAVKKYGDAKPKRVADHAYKFARAIYFRNRSPHANRPEYSGFDTLVYLSTGVIRGLLIPCYWMYEKMLSRESDGDARKPIHLIPPGVQSLTIRERSTAMWNWLHEEMDQFIVGCSGDDRLHAYQLLDQLAVYFRFRLLHHGSEPGANSFTISAKQEALTKDLDHVLEILREAQLLYVRSGVAKDSGRRELYYVPNRMLWPDRGLDPHGQHARVSITAEALWNAAMRNRPIPLEPVAEQSLADTKDVGLFDE